MLQQTWYGLGRIGVAAYGKLMLPLDIIGQKLPDGPKIIAANHPTTTDPILLTAITSQPMHILITEMCFNVPVVGRSLRLAGHVPVRDGNGRVAFEEAIRLLGEGQTVGIFPEGALSPLVEGGVGRPHTGVARMALMTGVPVIPVGIAVQRDRIRFVETTVADKTETARWYLRGPYAITVGEPIRLAGDVADRSQVRALSDDIMQRIGRLSLASARRIRVADAAVTRRDEVSEYAAGWFLA